MSWIVICFIVFVVVFQLIFNLYLHKLVDEVKIFVLLEITQGPKFRYEIVGRMKKDYGNNRFVSWIFLDKALIELLEEDLIRRTEEMDPISKKKKWKYYRAPKRPKRKNLNPEFSFWKKGLQPGLSPG